MCGCDGSQQGWRRCVEARRVACWRVTCWRVAYGRVTCWLNEQPVLRSRCGGSFVSFLEPQKNLLGFKRFLAYVSRRGLCFRCLICGRCWIRSTESRSGKGGHWILFAVDLNRWRLAVRRSRQQEKQRDDQRSTLRPLAEGCFVLSFQFDHLLGRILTSRFQATAWNGNSVCSSKNCRNQNSDCARNATWSECAVRNSRIGQDVTVLRANTGTRLRL